MGYSQGVIRHAGTEKGHGKIGCPAICHAPFLPLFCPRTSLLWNSCHSTAIPTLPRCCGETNPLAPVERPSQTRQLGDRPGSDCHRLGRRQSRAPVRPLSPTPGYVTLAGRTSATPQTPFADVIKSCQPPSPLLVSFLPGACLQTGHPSFCSLQLLSPLGLRHFTSASPASPSPAPSAAASWRARWCG